jgi:hypothetical protein
LPAYGFDDQDLERVPPDHLTKTAGLYPQLMLMAGSVAALGLFLFAHRSRVPGPWPLFHWSFMLPVVVGVRTVVHCRRRWGEGN